MQKRIHLRAQKTIQISSPTVTIIRNLSSGTAFREEHSIHLCQKKKKRRKENAELGQQHALKLLLLHLGKSTWRI